MHNIENVTIEENSQENKQKVYRVSYLQEGRFFERDVFKSLDTVKVLIYHEELDAFVLVKQFRALVYINHPELAVRYELCGGRVDKPISNIDIAREEVLEECGYDVKVEDMQKVTTLVTGGKMTLYFVKVNESMRVNNGGGIQNEMIEVIYLPVSEAKSFMFDERIPKRPALMFMFSWFLNSQLH